VLDISAADGAQTWTMRFGSVNAIDPDFLSALESALDTAIADETVAVVVITSGLRVFSAGADARWMGHVVRERGPAQLLAEFNRTMDRFRDLCIRMRRSDLLFIAALNGHTLAGGLELAAACDLRFAADHDRIQIGAPEMKLFGVMPSGGGGAQFIARLIGPARALNFILEAENCSPRRALELGLVERLYPPDCLLAEAEAFAHRISSSAGRIGINAAKRSILDATGLAVYEGLEVDRIIHWDSMRRGGFLPGVEKFVEQYG
jgi:enoyl-CoA hydratase/carnithine racemase